MAEATWEGKRRSSGRRTSRSIHWAPYLWLSFLPGILISIRFTFALDPMEQFTFRLYIRTSLIAAFAQVPQQRC